MNCVHSQADLVLMSLLHSEDLTGQIVHMDMDAFYAAVEMRNNPKLKDIPMAVGGEGMLVSSDGLVKINAQPHSEVFFSPPIA